MDNKNIGPNGNRYKDVTEDIKEIDSEKEENVDEDSPENIEAEIKKEEKLAKEQFRAKIVKMMGVIVIIIIIIILIGFIISLTSKKNYSYAEVEDVMKEAAKSYFVDNEKKLPTSKVKISSDVLAEEGYMNTLDKYLSNQTCSGEVIVENTGNKTYSYTSYLNCGEDYTTTELYKKVLDKKNIVTDGYGLYSYNSGYVYRGKDVNNYVKFDGTSGLWRIVKVNSNNEITLIQDDLSVNSYVWDERYNNRLEDTYGINDFKNSTVSTVIPKVYNNNLTDDADSDYYYYEEEPKLFTKNIKAKLLKFNSCVGKRADNELSRDGGPECSEVIETKISLLPVYDYLNASLDPDCTNTVSPSCQNYNYLAINGGFWLSNGVSTDNSMVYLVDYQGTVTSAYANSDEKLRLVVRVGKDMMIEKGNGSKKKPYVIR